MGKSLIIVESPAKIKTLKKFLGSDFMFESSVGHIRDLPAKEFGIDFDNDFTPTYVPLPEKKDVISRLRRAAKECETVYLCPDPDREGEAIAWHIASVLPTGTNIKRATFNAITPSAVQEGISQPRSIDEALVNAQQARRLLDRIVGYKISPILNRRIQRGKEGAVSAGRVQSVALKMVVDREKEIEAFVPVEYWTLFADLKNSDQPQPFRATVHTVDGLKVEKEPVEGKDVFLIGDESAANGVLDRLRDASYEVVRVDKKEKKRNPVPPFITSTLQQEASRHFGFSSNRTMQIAQALYEGIDMGAEGQEGLITYMRTDSVRIEPKVVDEARAFILREFGEDYLPAKPRQFNTKKTAQDAHEAIRPTNLEHPPERVRNYLNDDQFKLYGLIWKRFIASQMNPALYDTLSADIEASTGVILRATGSILKFRGFLAVYEEKHDEPEEDEQEHNLPPLEVGQTPNLLDVHGEQSFTRPPPRYSEASLVRELEKSGIGRPSTYVAIMQKIQSRDYTVKESGRLKPTELGRVIAAMLEANFQQIMNIGFTANMENDLELIAEDEKDWISVLREFWKDFEPTVETAEKEAFVPKILTEEDCPDCGAKLQKIWSKNKYFYGCSGYPDCNFTAPIEALKFDKSNYADNFDWEQKCPQCEADMVLRHGKYGAFLGCSKYPDCRGIVNIPKKGETYIPAEEMPDCPAIGCEGKLTARRSRFGKTFYSCTTFPDCDVIVNALEELQEKYPNHTRTAYVKKQRKGAKGKKATAKKKTAKTKRAPRVMAPSPLSPELSSIVGEPALPRNQVMKKVWDYIKEHKLQDEKDKRIINPDDKLTKLFGSSDPVQMFKMTGMISPHIGKSGAAEES